MKILEKADNVDQSNCVFIDATNSIKKEKGNVYFKHTGTCLQLFETGVTFYLRL
jgi:hypothetical protein